LPGGVDLDRAVAAGGLHELADRPAGAVLDEPGYRERGEHDCQVRLDRGAFVVVDRAGGKVVLGHPERFLDLEQPVVGADHELRARLGQVGDVALEPGQRAGLGLQHPVHGLVGADELDESVAFDRHLPGHRALGFGDLLVDAVQRAPGSISLVLVVDALRKAARPVQRAADGATITETDK